MDILLYHTTFCLFCQGAQLSKNKKLCYDTIDMIQKKEDKQPQICYDVNNHKNT